MFATSSHLTTEGTRPGRGPRAIETASSNQPVRLDPPPNALEVNFKKSLAKLWYY